MYYYSVLINIYAYFNGQLHNINTNAYFNGRYFLYLNNNISIMKILGINWEHHDLMVKIGNKIKELRKNKKMSYEKIAEEIGISRNCYNLIEHGYTNFQFEILLYILDYHNISVSDFFKDFN